MNILEMKKLLEENKTFIKERFFVTELGIFGSFVRGEHGNTSDIDILVSFRSGHKDFFNYIRLKYFLEELLKRNVDLVIKGAVKKRLRKKILNEVEYV